MTIPELDPSTLGLWLLSLSFLLLVWLNLRRVEREITGKGEHREIRPQPLEVKSHVRAATSEELTILANRVAVIEQRIEHQYRLIEERAEARSAKIHERINMVLSAVSEIRGEIKRI